MAMATPRYKLVAPNEALHYHLTSRCVRESFLLGKNLETGQDYGHRKQWLIDRMHLLARCFALDVEAYAIMDNHFHIVAYYDPTLADTWSDEEVVDRWLVAFPPKHRNGSVREDQIQRLRTLFLSNPRSVEHQRGTLGCMSMFMKYLKQPISRWANKEDGCSGHFFEQRFYSGALLSETAVLATMAYVDLNPIRANIHKTVARCRYTSMAERLKHLENTPEKLTAAIAPIAAGTRPWRKPRRPTQRNASSHSRLGRPATRPVITLAKYRDKLESLVKRRSTRESTLWSGQVAALRRKQRAYGSEADLNAWSHQRGFKQPGSPMPGSPA